MSKISTIGLACAVAALVFWKVSLNHPSMTPSVAGEVGLVPGQMVIPSNLPQSDGTGAY
jgi:hypothetical protein